MSKYSRLLEDDGQLFSISALYHENTKLSAWDAKVELTRLFGKTKRQSGAESFKTYPSARYRLKLPDVSGRTGLSLYQAIEKRCSTREYAPAPLACQDLAILLHYSCGITHHTEGQPMRASPSGGALYPLENYPVLFNVEGIEPGVYHYNVREHSLESVHLGSYQAALWEYSFRQDLVKQAAFMFVLTAIPARLQWKYGERAYRHILIEAGHVAENAYLVGTAAGIGICTIGGFQDDQIAQLIFLDGVQEFPVYLIAGGKALCA
jgi:SagB-type dehydrogenase family enzyme